MSGACACASEARCGATATIEGDFCPVAGGSTFGHCARDASGCVFVASLTNACSGSQTCNASGVVTTGQACGCPADGATLGTGCSTKTVGNTTGDTMNRAIVRCEMAGTCQVWKVQADCGATGLTVGVLNGVSVCVCQPASSGIYYVDPAPGMAMFMNGDPTGAQSPSACRLRSIKDALAHIATATGAAFNRIVVSHDPPLPVHLGAATGESFPLVVPAGITVTTADGANLDASHYVIDVDKVGAALSAVKLADGAVLSGFTIDASGAPGMANAATGVQDVVTCVEPQALQAATLDHVAVAARAGQTGVLASGACSLALNDVLVHGSSLGVDVARTSTVPGAQAAVTGRGLSVASDVAGAMGVRIGAGLDGGAGSIATLTAATLATRSLGVVVSGGVLSLDGGSIGLSNAATEDGVGAQITGGTVTLAGTILSGGARFTGLQLSGAAKVTLQANAGGPTRISTTLPATSSDGANGVVTAPGAVGASLTLAGGTQISRFASGLVINDGSVSLLGADVVLTQNRGNGVELLGRTSGAVVTLSGGTIRDNGGSGVVVRTMVPSTVENLSITGNAGDGLNVQRTQAAAQSGYRMVFAANTVTGNAGRGIAVTGLGVGTGVLSGGKVGVRLERNTVTGNGGVGVFVTEAPDAPDGDDVTEVSMDSNDVGGNLTAAATAPTVILAGGVFFAVSDATTRVVMGTFLGNRVHGNGRAEIGFGLSQDGGVPWNLSSNASGVDMATGCADTAKPNSVYCYDTVAGQDLGIAVASSAIQVSAQNMHFQNAIPTPGHDYSSGIAAGEISLPCSPQLCQ